MLICFKLGTDGLYCVTKGKIPLFAFCLCLKRLVCSVKVYSLKFVFCCCCFLQLLLLLFVAVIYSFICFWYKNLWLTSLSEVFLEVSDPLCKFEEFVLNTES